MYEELLKKLAETGVVGICLAVSLLANGTLFLFAKQLIKGSREKSEEYAKKVELLSNERISDYKILTAALGQNSTSLAALGMSLESRTVAFGEVASGFALQSQAANTLTQTVRECLNRIESDISDIQRQRRGHA